jgi:hypothetical protein
LQSFAAIAFELANERPAVVQAAVAADPELDALGHHAKPSPVCGAGHDLHGCEARLDLANLESDLKEAGSTPTTVRAVSRALDHVAAGRPKGTALVPDPSER